MTILEGSIEKTYNIAAVNTLDTGMKDFLFTLGCYPGEHITLISRVASNLVVNVKDARYSFDKGLAAAIEIRELEKEGPCLDTEAI